MRAPALVALMLAAAALLGGARTARGASPWSDHQVVGVRLIGAPATRPGGDAGQDPPGELRLGLHVRLAPHWHVYWRHPGDAGLPPELVLAAETPLGPPRLLFPAPRRFHLRGGLVANGYEGEVVYPVRVPLPPGAPVPPRLTATVDYLACEEECIPFHDELELDLGAVGRAEAELLERWEARLPVAAARSPGVAAEATFRGSSEGGELVLEIAGGPAREVFVAPIERIVVGNPVWEAGGPASGVPARAIVPVQPESAGAMPATLLVEWVATGIPGAGAGEAVEGAAEVATAAAGAASASAGAGAERGDPGPLGSLLRGAALALTPGALALLLLAAASRGGGGPGRWLAPPVAALALATFLALTAVAGRAAGVSLPLGEPLALATLALPHLALALALWWGGAARIAEAPAWAAASGAALLALPFAPALAGGGPSVEDLAPLAAGFALPWILAAALAALGRGEGRGDGTAPAGSSAARSAIGVGLGFLPAASLAWVVYRLSPALPGARLATVQLAWLGAALAVWLARGARPAMRPVWWAAALACAGAAAWLAR